MEKENLDLMKKIGNDLLFKGVATDIVQIANNKGDLK